MRLIIPGVLAMRLHFVQYVPPRILETRSRTFVLGPVVREPSPLVEGKAKPKLLRERGRERRRGSLSSSVSTGAWSLERGARSRSTSISNLASRDQGVTWRVLALAVQRTVPTGRRSAEDGPACGHACAQDREFHSQPEAIVVDVVLVRSDNASSGARAKKHY